MRRCVLVVLLLATAGGCSAAPAPNDARMSADGAGADREDTDTDGDGILDRVEGTSDTDADGTPDVRDLDSDADTILDADETGADLDGDGRANFRDLDSDDDDVLDANEAGDADLATPPVECPNELDPSTLVVRSDGRADAYDRDSDGDDLEDGDEVRAATDPCDADTDDDGAGDAIESIYARLACPAPPVRAACTCAVDPLCTPPASTWTTVVVPYGGPADTRDISVLLDASWIDRIDVTARLRDDVADPFGVDARRLVSVVEPACAAGIDPCWTEPAGIAHADAVASVDGTFFYAVAPATTLLFHLTFQNTLPCAVDTRTYFIALDAIHRTGGVVGVALVALVVPGDALCGTF